MSKGKIWEKGYRKDHAHHYNYNFKVCSDKHGHKKNRKWFFRNILNNGEGLEFTRIGFSKLSWMTRIFHS